MRKKIPKTPSLVLVACVLVLAALAAASDSQQIDFTYYHTTEQINIELDRLVQDCEQNIQVTATDADPDVKIVKINNRDDASLSAFVLFGEHPRELISPETGLNFVKALCGKSDGSYSNINFLLDNVEFQVVVNANPKSRKRVEEGCYCLRENENGIDINRNYDAHWEFVQDDVNQVSSGSQPFSETETQAIRDAVLSFEPDYFITVHSGTLGLYTPYAYSTEPGERNEEAMRQIMGTVSDQFCTNCEVGAAGELLGYLCPGTSLDWVYDEIGADYAFAIEIYSKQDRVHTFNSGGGASPDFALIVNQESSAKNSHTLLRRSVPRGDILELAERSEGSALNSEWEQCFLYFNPGTEEEYSYVVDTWTKAILYSVELALDDTLAKRGST